jgi:hypothetical protein
MGGLSCYTMCTSSQHAALAAQALRRGRVSPIWLGGPHTVARRLCIVWVPTRKFLASESLLLPPPLRVVVVIRFWISACSYFVTSCVSSRELHRATTECDLGETCAPSGAKRLPRVHSDIYVKTYRPSRGICFQNKHP